MMNKQFIPLILALCLCACGFHLRGMIDVPEWLTNVAIISKDGSNKELVSMLKTQLEGYGVQVNPNPQNSQYWLIINRTSYGQQISSIGASTNPRQYQLFLTVEFLLQTRKGDSVKPPATVQVTRQLTVNNDRILGSNEEETVLISEMRQDAVIQMINRLSRK